MVTLTRITEATQSATIAFLTFPFPFSFLSIMSEHRATAMEAIINIKYIGIKRTPFHYKLFGSKKLRQNKSSALIVPYFSVYYSFKTLIILKKPRFFIQKAGFV